MRHIPHSSPNARQQNPPAMLGERPRYRFGPVAIVSLSLLIPSCIVAVSIALALWGKPFGYSSKEQDYVVGTVKNGELWHFSTVNGASLGPNVAEHRIKRTDLKTGKQIDTGLSVRSQFLAGVWLNDEYYVCTELATYKLIDGRLEQLGGSPPNWKNELPGAPFAYDGKLSKVTIALDGNTRLSQFVDGNWTLGRRVLFPSAGRQWYRDPQTDRIRLLPVTSEQQVGLATGRIRLTVIQQGDQTHLFIYEYPRFSAYRSGFEFVEEEDSVASALAPANSAHEVSGWEAIFDPEPTHRYSDDQMACDAEGPIFSYWGAADPQCRFIRRLGDGSLKTLSMPRHFGLPSSTHLCADPTRNDAYLVACGPFNWSRKDVSRIEGNAVQQWDIWMTSNESEYLLRWSLVGLGLVMAWLTHVVVLTGGADRRAGKMALSNYQFGHERVTLASNWQRGSALVVDLVLVFVIFLPFQFLGLEFSDRHRGTLSWRLRDLEMSLAGVSRPFVPYDLIASMQNFVDAFRMHFMDPLSFYVVLAWLSLVISLNILFQGRYGLTPGKWLFGIRTVGATLRPCGMFRSLVRTLLYCVDLTSFLTPLPAAISIMHSDHRQRLGDRVTDTIVIQTP